ncbi:hypothetical protein FNT36_24865 [Hymenobacter setariae]|uniref:Competence protein CoiA-like family protein n=1 Tax=Hymenobacter setariae TaxID=2594794 RepID=A0A558BJR5_9BACT|nr:hypothetical protein [Hymenobacter setariae]TVT36748.1 hypothetical protein FNT36_24865 [Hymenobacter setariae]
MAATLKLPYGLRDGQLLHIADVANGLACACVCPGCGARLVARNQGKVKVAHFAHHQAPECATGLQTALHLAAKDVFTQHSTFWLPGAAGFTGFRADNFQADDYFASFSFRAQPYQAEVEHALYEDGLDYKVEFAPRPVTIRRAWLEHRTADLIPDIVLETEAGLLLVEVAVTHFVDQAKLTKLRQWGISCVEIDLSKCSRDLAGPELADVLLHQTTHKRWVYNGRLAARLATLHTQYLERARPLFLACHTQAMREQKRQRWEQDKKESLQAFYATRCKPITLRPDPRPPHRPERHVLPCPDPRRAFAVESYANVDTDCMRCSHFRGYGGGSQHQIVCLYEYNKWEKFNKPPP